MIEQFGKGDMSSRQVRNVAHMFGLDGSNSAVMRALKSLGSDGVHPANTERYLHVCTRNMFGCSLEPQTLRLKLETPDSEVPRDVDIGILPMHEVLHAIANAGPLQFEVSLVGPEGEDGIARLWEYARQFQRGQDRRARKGEGEGPPPPLPPCPPPPPPAPPSAANHLRAPLRPQ